MSMTIELQGRGQVYKFIVDSTNQLNDQALAIMDSPNSKFGLEEYGALWFIAGKADLDERLGGTAFGS